jgi:hypothetical protein
MDTERVYALSAGFIVNLSIYLIKQKGILGNNWKSKKIILLTGDPSS